MITEQDLNAAIAECIGARNPDANTCIKLAAYYTIKDHLYPDSKAEHTDTSDRFPAYSYAAAPEQAQLDSDTEFAKAVQGMEPGEVWPILDEAMTILQAAYPRMYTAIMDKLR